MQKQLFNKSFSPINTRSREEIGDIVERNRGLVVTIAKFYNNEFRAYMSGFDFEDLIQEGSIGLMEAAKKFDEKRGFQFSTYATWWIRQKISRAIIQKAYEIRIPDYLVEKLRKLHREMVRLTMKYGRPVSLTEIISQTDLTPDKKRAIIESSNLITVSIATLTGTLKNRPEEQDFKFDQSMFRDRRSKTPLEILMEKEREDLKRRFGKYVYSLPRLSERAKKIYIMRMGLNGSEPMSVKEVANKLGIGSSAVSVAYKAVSDRIDKRKLREHL